MQKEKVSLCRGIEMRKIAHFCRIFRAKLKFLQILQAESVSN
jgi:hypothetical protein